MVEKGDKLWDVSRYSADWVKICRIKLLARYELGGYVRVAISLVEGQPLS